MSLAYLAAARGEDAANRRRGERVPPGSPQGVAGDCALASPTLKWRLKCLSILILELLVSLVLFSSNAPMLRTSDTISRFSANDLILLELKMDLDP
jgi:hypothetical protein